MMPAPTRPLWDTVAYPGPPMVAAAALVLAAAGAAAGWLGSSVTLALGTAVLALGGVLLWPLARTLGRTGPEVMYHSDDDGLVVAPRAGGLICLPWDAIIEIREGPCGGMVLATAEAAVRLPGYVARRDAFGMAVFERVVPRLAGELWDGLASGRMVAICPERRGIALTLLLGLGVAAGLLIPGGMARGLGVLAAAVVLFVIARSRTRGVFLSARGIGDRDRFIGWEAAELREHRWALVVRDSTTGWVARIPRRAANYQAIAVVARAAQALSGSGVQSIAFRSASDSGRIRIVVEGNLPGGDQYH